MILPQHWQRLGVLVADPPCVARAGERDVVQDTPEGTQPGLARQRFRNSGQEVIQRLVAWRPVNEGAGIPSRETNFARWSDAPG